MQLFDQIQQARDFIRSRWGRTPKAGIVLGTGLGALAADIQTDVAISYNELPHILSSTAPSHKGQLVCGTLAGKPVVAMEGRFHFYEGYSMQQVTFPVRVMSSKAGLGVKTLITSNAVGGMNPDFRRGDIMVITDHINLQGDNPLIGPNDEEMGPRFPDMSEPYTQKLMDLAQSVASDLKIDLRHGVLVAVQGPNLETKSEYRFLRTIGADAVGMSTVPEVIVAVHMGMKVLSFSIITDECFPETLRPVTMEEVIAVANKAEPKLTKIMKEVVKRM